MSHESFSRFYSDILARLEARVRSFVPLQDADDVIQNAWVGFWTWLQKRDEAAPEDHVGMLFEFAKWRIRDYYKERQGDPILLENPEAVAIAGDLAGEHAEHRQELERASGFLNTLTKRSGGNILRLLLAATESRKAAEKAIQYDLVRGYLEHTLGTAERVRISTKLLGNLPSRQSLDSGVNRLVRSWNQLAPKVGISPLTRARAAPRRGRSRSSSETYTSGWTSCVEFFLAVASRLKIISRAGWKGSINRLLSIIFAKGPSGTPLPFFIRYRNANSAVLDAVVAFLS